jgi:hypothetical protein
MTDNDKNQWYFKGKFFDEEQLFWEYVVRWPNLFSTIESRKLARDHLMITIEKYMEVYLIDLKNHRIEDIMEQVLMFFFKLMEENKDKP